MKRFPFASLLSLSTALHAGSGYVRAVLKRSDEMRKGAAETPYGKRLRAEFLVRNLIESAPGY